MLKELTVYEEVFTHRAVEPSGKAMPLKPVVDGNVQAPRLWRSCAFALGCVHALIVS